MCSAADDPTTYDPPTPVKPRVYRLSGSRPVEEPRGDPWTWLHDNEFSWEDVNAIAAILGARGFEIVMADEYKEATDAAMNYGQGFAAGRTIALAVLGEMLNNAEWELGDTDPMRFPLLWDIRIAKVDVLRVARDAVAAAEAKA